MFSVTFAVDTTYQVTDDCIENSNTAHELIDVCVCGISRFGRATFP